MGDSLQGQVTDLLTYENCLAAPVSTGAHAMVTPGSQDESVGPTVLRTKQCGRVPYHSFVSLAHPQKVSKILSGTVAP